MVRLASLFAGFALTLLPGCKTYQDVSPQLESAIQSYESAQKLEARLVEEETATARLVVNSAFASLEDACLTTLRALLRSGWDNANGDFQPNKKSTAWPAWYGSSESVDSAENESERMRIRGALNDPFTWTGGVGGRTDAWTLYSRGQEPKDLASPPPPADLPRVTADYAAWKRNFEADVLRGAPVYRKVVQAHSHASRTIELQRTRRLERMELVYGDLITLSKLARDQAKTLTDNAGFISLANNLARMATRALGDVTEKTEETAEQPQAPETQ